MERVNGYVKRVKGRLIHVSGYIRKNHNNIDAHDRAVDRRNVRKAENARKKY